MYGNFSIFPTVTDKITAVRQNKSHVRMFQFRLFNLQDIHRRRGSRHGPFAIALMRSLHKDMQAVALLPEFHVDGGFPGIHTEICQVAHLPAARGQPTGSENGDTAAPLLVTYLIGIHGQRSRG